MLPFALFRLPAQTNAAYVEGPLIDGLSEGFAIRPFAPHSAISTIAGPTTNITCQDAAAYLRKHLTTIPPIKTALPETTTEKEYMEGAQKILHAISSGQCRKIVYSRVARVEQVDIAQSFASLCTMYPRAYVYCFYTPEHGIWMGASPELLCQISQGTLHTMALAGTKSGTDATPWDEKNCDEQQIVTDFIAQELTACMEHVMVEPREELTAGPVKHLCTKIHAILPKGDFPSMLANVVRALSPTPALAGMPRHTSCHLLSQTEHHRRALYGGCCGPCHPAAGEATLWVNLRCLQSDGLGAAIYAGGGYTIASIPRDEWTETQYKISTLLKAL